MKTSRKAKKEKAPGPGRGYLDGQMLIAMPAMNDERFARAVIYVCAHSTEGAMGIVVNHPAANIKFPDLLVQLEVIPAVERIQLPTRAEDVKVLKGGPVETGRGFVLHSADFFIENSTLPIDEGICLTAMGRRARYLRSATRAGRPDSSNRKSSKTGGCIARPTPSSFSARTRKQNTRRRCARSALISACCRAKPAMPSALSWPGIAVRRTAAPCSPMSRPSMTCFLAKLKDVDARHKAGHDD
jgi:putative AlgH/UPF0301 family transcriptional regulator